MVATQPMTVEEFEVMPDVPGKRFKLIDGQLAERTLFGFRVGVIATNVFRRLYDHAEKQRRLGLVFMSGLGYILRRNPDTVRMATASFIDWRSAPDTLPEGCWPGAPDIAVDIVSPDDRADVIHTRVRDFLQAGTRYFWVLWPETRSVTVHTADGTIREYESDDDVDGGDVLPGFRFRIGDLFEIPMKPAS